MCKQAGRQPREEKRNKEIERNLFITHTSYPAKQNNQMEEERWERERERKVLFKLIFSFSLSNVRTYAHTYLCTCLWMPPYPFLCVWLIRLVALGGWWIELTIFSKSLQKVSQKKEEGTFQKRKKFCASQKYNEDIFKTSSSMKRANFLFAIQFPISPTSYLLVGPASQIDVRIVVYVSSTRSLSRLNLLSEPNTQKKRKRQRGKERDQFGFLGKKS